MTDRGIRYANTNLVAKDWRRLMDFYCEVFGCVAIGSERDNRGPNFDALTTLEGGSVRGRHLRLPGHGDAGPTLEIFQFDPTDPTPPPEVNRPGFTHLAFEVPDVESKRKEIAAWGGSDYGRLVTIDIPGAGKLTLIYMRDPEGNILELQKWHS
jgi:predicted enzyme related to lactoylglutathione lyase